MVEIIFHPNASLEVCECVFSSLQIAERWIYSKTLHYTPFGLSPVLVFLGESRRLAFIAGVSLCFVLADL